MVAMDDERELIVRSQNGDQEAFAILIKQHQRMIHSLCYRMSGSSADADDLAQEAFIQAHRQLDHFRGEASFATWLYRIALNQCLNWGKRERRRSAAHREWSEQSQEQASSQGAKVSQVNEAVMRLKPKQRAALVLTVYEGMTHAEAARALGCSETTVSWRIFAARRKLKFLLRRTEGEHE